MVWGLLIILILLVASWVWTRREADRAGLLPAGEVLYRDTEQKFVEETLYSERYGLVGRPDYIISGPDGMVPVELKKGGCPLRGPYQNHQAQLFGYCLLVEDAYNTVVSHGVLRYADREVRIEFTPKSRAWVLQVLAAVAAAKQSGLVSRNHSSAGRCRGCSLRHGCVESLV